MATQLGCLSRQEFDEQYPPNGTSFENLIDLVDISDTKSNQTSRKDKQRSRKRDEATSVEVITEVQDCESSDKKNKERFAGATMSFQNCTLQCADPGNGESYWVSFEEKSFSKGNDFKVYSGRMNGVGPRSGDKCVVKVFRRCTGTENMCRCEVKKCQKAKVLARAFNDEMLDQKVRIKLTSLYWAHMDEVSKIKQLFFTGKRKLTTRETVLFEDDLRVNDEKPSKSKQPTMFMDCHGKKKSCIAKDLEAFAHFTYHISNGELVLCSLDGVQDEDGFFLKTPTIHSMTQEYGSSDCGLRGILEVFSNHVCNDFCKDMIKPSKDLNNVSADTKVRVSVENCSTVPEFATQEQEESSIPHVVSIMHRPPLERQDSVISRVSYISDNNTTWRQVSNQSQVTDSLSGYLEPSAPMEDCCQVMLEPNPPPYSSVNVANWLLHEHAQNSFINSTITQVSPPPRTDSLVNQVSVESGLGSSMVVPSEGSSFKGTSMDMNANFPEEDVDTSGISTSGCYDDCDESDRTASVQCNKKRVRFSLSSDAPSSPLLSETATAASSDGPVKMSMIRSAGRANAQFNSFLKHHSAGSLIHNNSQANPYTSLHLVNRRGCCAMPRSELNTYLDADHGSRCNMLVPESPPSYLDSEMTTAWWIMQRGCTSEKPNINTACHTDNGYSNTDMVKSNHHSSIPNAAAKISVLKKSQSQ